MKLGDRVTVTNAGTAASFLGKTGTVSRVLQNGTIEVAIDWLRLQPIRFAPYEVAVQEPIHKRSEEER